MRLKVSIVTFLACLAGLPLAAWPTGPRLTLTDADGRVRLAAPVAVGDRFTIRFTHSVARSPVEEIFEISADDHYHLRETVYADFGAGLPHEEHSGQKMVFSDGRIRLSGYSVRFDTLTLRVGHIARHAVVLPDGNAVELANLFGPGAEVGITVQRRPYWRWWLG